jgi:hypothetical protein
VDDLHIVGEESLWIGVVDLDEIVQSASRGGIHRNHGVAADAEPRGYDLSA